MGYVPHQTRDKKRRLITNKELAKYFGQSKTVIKQKIKEYKKLDYHDIFSVLDFAFWLVENL